jgi:hypothetical protein
MERSRAALLVGALALGSCFGPVPLFGRSGPCPASTEQHTDGCWPHEHTIAANVGGWCEVEGSVIRCRHRVYDATSGVTSEHRYTVAGVTGWTAIALGPQPWTMPVQGRGDRLFAIAPSGRMFVAGVGTSGTLGVGSDAPVPELVPVESSDGTRYRSVCGGTMTSCAVTLDGALECWGHDALPPPLHGTIAVPTRVEGWNDWVSVSCWDRLTCGLRDAGQVHCWGGYNAVGGVPSSAMNYEIADALVLPAATTISVGREHACALTLDGTWCWGRASFVGVGQNETNPLPPTRLDVVPLRRLSAGMTTTCGLAASGEDHVWCWGANGSGQTGIPASVDDTFETPSPGDGGAPIDVAAGSLFTAFQSTGPTPTLRGDLTSVDGP